MTYQQGFARPAQTQYDVVIIGGAIMGSSAAWFLSDTPDFDGSVLVVERDPSFATASTSHTNSCMRQQFSTALNVRISQFGAAFVKDMHNQMGRDPRVPDLKIQSFGYMYLADTEAFADVLRANQVMQTREGAATQVMTPGQIAADYPFYHLDDIVLGSINRVNEGYFDGAAMFDAWRRQARERGVDYLCNEVVAVTKNASGSRVVSVTLQTGEVIACGHVVNAAGPRAARVAAMAGIALPVEPRKRFSWVFRAERPLDRDLPLTIDPSGVHVRENGGGTYMCGAHTSTDPAVDPNDFAMDSELWQDHVWPILAFRIPQFEAIRVQSEWAGHYAMNTFDRNAIVGPHPDIANFLFINGFSGHGLQQSPAMGRAISEWICHGAFRTLDMTPLGFARLLGQERVIERAVI